MTRQEIVTEFATLVQARLKFRLKATLIQGVMVIAACVVLAIFQDKNLKELSTAFSMLLIGVLFGNFGARKEIKSELFLQSLREDRPDIYEEYKTKIQ